MIGNVEANSRSQKIGDDVPELEGLIGKQGLYKLAHNAAEEEAYEDGEKHWTMAPEPYPPVFLLDIKDKVEDSGGDSQAEEV